ncbi:MFS transporter [Dermabacter hominis]|uniref:MFS transporter n=1 Tax=Dermabacter hominis TaxID=36740 RepID=UPI0021A7FCDA|nr:MFS transporter [Dermabacter hominis]MCT2056810.1 MFS transporter [Dermabacter hominis]MCT2084257.1 MFS transporter [Dermabacter hominis]MCT2092222.1 MFS transporter [Dermabacter hominis]MCT2191213.1 MFS transporter [Dermabacter hominis]MCT2227779.1 MFS transporter [Dermabacter hominis]
MSLTHLRWPALTLASTLFVVTTSEFQVAAMLTDMADGLHQPIEGLALLVTIYSLGSALGGPMLTWPLRHLRTKTSLIAVVLAYAVAEVAAGFAPNFTILAVFRFVTGCLSGATFGLALTLGMALTNERDRPRVSASILSGLVAGTLLGLPLSHLLGMWSGWRTSFLLLGGAAAVMAAGVAVLIHQPDRAPAPDGSDHGGLASWALWSRFAASFLTIGGAFAAFALIDPILKRGGLSPAQATGTMVAFGVAALVGNRLSGRAAPGRARGWLLIGLGIQLVALIALGLLPTTPLIVVVAVIGLGATGMALNPLLVNRVVTVAGSHALSNTVHTACITLGVAAATALGSRAIATSGGLTGTVLVGIALTAAAGIVVAATPDQRAATREA